MQGGGYVVPGLANTWHHFAFSYDPGSGIQYVLVDGATVSTVPPTGAPTHDAVVHNQGFNIGARYTGASQFITGRMDDVRIWNIYRTATDLAGNNGVGMLAGNAIMVVD